jgi:hypothetical protein
MRLVSQSHPLVPNHNFVASVIRNSRIDAFSFWERLNGLKFQDIYTL